MARNLNKEVQNALGLQTFCPEWHLLHESSRHKLQGGGLVVLQLDLRCGGLSLSTAEPSGAENLASAAAAEAGLGYLQADLCLRCRL